MVFVGILHFVFFFPRMWLVSLLITPFPVVVDPYKRLAMEAAQTRHWIYKGIFLNERIKHPAKDAEKLECFAFGVK